MLMFSEEKVDNFFLAHHLRVYSGVSGFLPLLRKRRRKRNALKQFYFLCKGSDLQKARQKESLLDIDQTSQYILPLMFQLLVQN